MANVVETGECIVAKFKVDFRGFGLDVDLCLPNRGVTALFGHSGSGKTTLLRCIAGLERNGHGYLSLFGQVWQDDARKIFLPTWKRPLGYVFQEASLFAHLTIKGNLEYGQKRVPESERRVSLDHVVDMLGIGHLMDRYPDRLSVGESQRAGIARALATSPRILLMDEPMAALDLKRKQEILPYLEKLHTELDIPVLYVTHSPDEVQILADYLVVMEGGSVLANGFLDEIPIKPGSPFANDAIAELLRPARSASRNLNSWLSC